MEPKIGNLRLATGTLKSRPDAAPRAVAVALAEHEAGRLRRLRTRRVRRERGTRRSIERLERVVHCSIHRDLAPAPVLGLLEQQDAAGEVDVLPDQSEDLPFPHASVEGDRDNREQIGALTSLAVLPGGRTPLRGRLARVDNLRSIATSSSSEGAATTRATGRPTREVCRRRSSPTSGASPKNPR